MKRKKKKRTSLPNDYKSSGAYKKGPKPKNDKFQHGCEVEPTSADPVEVVSNLPVVKYKPEGRTTVKVLSCSDGGIEVGTILFRYQLPGYHKEYQFEEQTGRPSHQLKAVYSY